MKENQSRAYFYLALICSTGISFRPLMGGTGVWTTNGPYEGYYNAGVVRLAVDPVSNATLYAGTCDNGIYKTEDGGITWRTINSGLEYRATYIMALAVDPSNPQVVYAGTGDETVSYGIFKSIDGGESWDAINAGLPDHAYIIDMVIDPSNSSTLYVSTWSGAGHIYKSTNAGASWVALPHYRATAIAIDPLSSQTLYAAYYSNELFKSTDGGLTWKSIRMEQDVEYHRVYSIAIDPINPATIYVGLYGGGIIKSIDGGEHWTAITAGLTSNYVFCLAIDPLSPSTIYAGTLGDGVFQTTDGGENWTEVNNGLENYSNYLVDDLAVVPSCAHAVYAAIGEVWSISFLSHCRPVNRPR